MKQDNYKPLGRYIQLIDKRNHDGAISKLVGVSFEKKIIPSIANTIGTDLSNYRIIKPGQFAYCPVTSRNGERISIALYKGEETAILSVAYSVFEITKPEELDADYLMLWVSRPEFDRYARFMSHGSVRELFSWEEMCNVLLPVPSIEEQRRIVSEYQTVERRIKNNEAMIKKLEETAQAIYNHTFVEGIDENNLPEGWKKESLYDAASFLNGQPCQKYEDEKGTLPVLKIRELSQGNTDSTSNLVDKSFPSEYVIKQGDLIFSWSATLLVRFWEGCDCALNQHLFKVSSTKYPLWFIYMWIQRYIFIWKNIISAKATSMGHIKKEDLQNADILVPSDYEFNELDRKMNTLYKNMSCLQRETSHLRTLLSLLTSKLS